MSNRVESVMSEGRILAMLGVLSLSDEEAYNHAVAVAELVNEYLELSQKADELEWTEEECRSIVAGALLHDIGKGFLPFGLQHSSAKLSKYEKEVVKTHPLLGIVSVKNCDFGQIEKDIILKHHANADGSGYPSTGEELNESTVPDYVWIVAYADRFEAMVGDRSFKRAKTYPDAWKEILSMSRNGVLPYKFARLFSEIVKKRSILSIENCQLGELHFSRNRSTEGERAQ